MQRLPLFTRAISASALACVAGLAQADSLTAPGTTTFENQWIGDVTTPVTIGADHTVILDTFGDLFVLETALINQGKVEVRGGDDAYYRATLFSAGELVNRGTWNFGNQVDAHLFGEFDNRAGVIQIGVNSEVNLHGSTPLTGRIHGASTTSNLLAHAVQNATFSGHVNLISAPLPPHGSAGPMQASGTLTVDGTLRASGLALTSDTTLQGAGRTVLAGGAIGLASPALPAQLTVAAGHTLQGHGQVAGAPVLNQGTLEATRGQTLVLDAGLVQQGDGSLTLVNGTLKTPLLRVDGGVLEIGPGATVVDGDVEVGAGQVVLHADPDPSWWRSKVSGELTLSERSTLELVVDESNAGLISVVVGEFHADGNLLLTFAEGTSLLDAYIVELWGWTSGSFRSMQVGIAGATPQAWAIAYQQDGALIITAVPEPHSAWLLTFGLAMLAWLAHARRRRAQPASAFTPPATAPTSRNAGAC